MPGGEATKRSRAVETSTDCDAPCVVGARLEGFRELFLSRISGLEEGLKGNSKDTAETKKLLIGILVSVVLGFIASNLKGCTGL